MTWPARPSNFPKGTLGKFTLFFGLTAKFRGGRLQDTLDHIDDITSKHHAPVRPLQRVLGTDLNANLAHPLRLAACDDAPVAKGRFYLDVSKPGLQEHFGQLLA